MKGLNRPINSESTYYSSYRSPPEILYTNPKKNLSTHYLNTLGFNTELKTTVQVRRIETEVVKITVFFTRISPFFHVENTSL